MNVKSVSNVVHCLSLVIFLVTLFGDALAQAASHEKKDGTIVDPIFDTSFQVHPYSGPNLESEAILTDAVLNNANLSHANLTEAGLPRANLTDVNLTNADLTQAHLVSAGFFGVSLTNAWLVQTCATRT